MSCKGTCTIQNKHIHSPKQDPPSRESSVNQDDIGHQPNIVSAILPSLSSPIKMNLFMLLFLLAPLPPSLLLQRESPCLGRGLKKPRSVPFEVA